MLIEGDGGTQLSVFHTGNNHSEMLLAVDGADDGLAVDGVAAFVLIGRGIGIGSTDELPRLEDTLSLVVLLVKELDSKVLAFSEGEISPAAVGFLHSFCIPLSDADNIIACAIGFVILVLIF